MTYNAVTAFLSGALSPEMLANAFGVEAERMKADLAASGAVKVGVLRGKEFTITRTGALRLLEAVADSRLPFDVANYIADCIVGSHIFHYEDEAVRDAIFFLEDDSGRSVSGSDDWSPSREETLAALAKLK